MSRGRNRSYAGRETPDRHSPRSPPDRGEALETVVNGANTSWVLVSAALVLLMTPGLAFFYGGMTRSKSVLNMMMMSFGAISIVSVLWVLYGFSVAFGEEKSGLWGGLDWAGMKHMTSIETTLNGSVYGIPLLVFAAFQLMFAIITVALI